MGFTLDGGINEVGGDIATAYIFLQRVANHLFDIIRCIHSVPFYADYAEMYI
jgi:hypothetical protein